CSNALFSSALSLLSLHDALPISIFVVLSQAVGTFVDTMFPGGTYSPGAAGIAAADFAARVQTLGYLSAIPALIYVGAYYLVWNRDRKSTRLNSSHVSISYAVFCS